MIRVKYSYWNGSEVDVIEFKTDATPTAIRKTMKAYDNEYDVGGFDGTLEEYVKEQGYKFKPYLDKYDVEYEN